MHGAAYLFHKQGYDKTTVRELAQFIGIQSGSLFHHFKSKDDILAHVMEQTIIYNLARLNDAATQSTDPEQQLRALIKAELISITGDTGAAMAVLVYEWFALSKEKQDYLLKCVMNMSKSGSISLKSYAHKVKSNTMLLFGDA